MQAAVPEQWKDSLNCAAPYGFSRLPISNMMCFTLYTTEKLCVFTEEEKNTQGLAAESHSAEHV